MDFSVATRGLCPLVWTNPASREVAEARGGFERTRVIRHPQKQRKATTGLHEPATSGSEHSRLRLVEGDAGRTSAPVPPPAQCGQAWFVLASFSNALNVLRRLRHLMRSAPVRVPAMTQTSS